jgi:uncharacterized protein YeaO (DUF488 family)
VVEAEAGNCELTGAGILRMDLQYQKKNMPAAHPQIALKRVYDKPADSDGLRILVDRLWPRGLKKGEAKVDAWLRDLAPSNDLRKWFHAHPEQWPLFRKRYLHELRSPSAAKALNQLYASLSQKGRLTLLFASKDEEHNNAIVLKALIEGTRKPPSGTKPAAARAVRARQSRRTRG